MPTKMEFNTTLYNRKSINDNISDINISVLVLKVKSTKEGAFIL